MDTTRLAGDDYLAGKSHPAGRSQAGEECHPLNPRRDIVGDRFPRPLVAMV